MNFEDGVEDGAGDGYLRGKWSKEVKKERRYDIKEVRMECRKRYGMMRD